MDAEFARYLDRVRSHRAELRDCVSALDEALASPLSRGPLWLERVHGAMAELSADFREHVSLTEGEGGLYASVLASAPRLSGPARTLVEEHRVYGKRIDTALAGLDAREAVKDLGELREELTTLVGLLVRHRQRGADLVYEAYEVDLGGQG